MHPEWLINKSIPKEEAHDESRQESAQEEEREESDCRSYTFLEHLSQAGQQERTEGVKSVNAAFRG